MPVVESRRSASYKKGSGRGIKHWGINFYACGTGLRELETMIMMWKRGLHGFTFSHSSLGPGLLGTAAIQGNPSLLVPSEPQSYF
jgi:hypothetical protein